MYICPHVYPVCRPDSSLSLSQRYNRSRMNKAVGQDAKLLQALE